MEMMNIETAVRISPQTYNNSEVIVQCDTLNNIVHLGNNHSYPINYALPIDCCQTSVYNTSVSPLVKNFLDGIDISVVALGQSGTGKTYTLFGPGFHFAASETEHGIIPRFIREVYAKLKLYRNRTTSVRITWSQICGENVQDLLEGGSIECTSIIDAFQLIQLGLSNICSRSAHTLFTFTLDQQWVVESTVYHLVSTASFADLFGSEKVFIYDNNGILQNIPVDSGLQNLQRCIMILAESCITQINMNNVPYTQSVLTTLLKDSFGGRAKTLLMCCVSPLLNDFAETFYTLQLAVHAQLIKNCVTVNSYSLCETMPDNCDIFGLKFAANQLFKLVSNAEDLFQKLISNGTLNKIELEQISQWLTLKQECEECLSEASDIHRSLERIEEEIEDSENSTHSESEIIEEQETQNIMDKVDILMEHFIVETDKLVAKPNVGSFSNSLAVDSVNTSYNTYSSKGARGRRGSIYSDEALLPSLNSLNCTDDDTLEENKQKDIQHQPMSCDSKKKVLKQIITTLDGCDKQIIDLEETIRVKEDLVRQLLKHKDIQSNVQLKFDQICRKLEKEYETLQEKVDKTQDRKNHYLEEKYKIELRKLENKLDEAKSLRNITEGGSKKLIELESSLQNSRKQLDKLKKYKKKEMKRKRNYEIELEAEEKSTKYKDSSDSTGKDACSPQVITSTDMRAVVLLNHSNYRINISPTVALPVEKLEHLRHEIRNLRKTRDFLIEQRCKINFTSQNRKILSDIEERKLLQYEEAIEAIDLAIEYKNEIICGHIPVSETIFQRQEEQGDRMLMDRLLNLSENEMRVLLHRYFQKVIDLRSSTRKLEMQVMAVENQNENLTYRVQSLSHALQQVRLEADRTVVRLQQKQDENIMQVLMKFLANDDSSSEVTTKLPSSPKKPQKIFVKRTSNKTGESTSLITKITSIAGQETVPRQLKTVVSAPQAKITRQKNKIIIQQKQ